MSKKPDVSREFDARATDFSRRSTWATDELILRDCLDLLKSLQVTVMVDLGGGNGLLGDFLRKNISLKEIIVVDRSPKMLDLVPAGMKQIQANIEEELPLDVFRADLITLRQVLHYLENPQRTLKALSDRIQPSTSLYLGQIVAPTNDSKAALDDIIGIMNTSRQRVFTLESLYREVCSAGLVVEKIRLTPFMDDFTDWKTRNLGSGSSALGTLIGTSAGRDLQSHIVEGVEYFRMWFSHLLVRQPLLF